MQMKLINLYGQRIMDCETSPFEMLETFHIRSKLHRLIVQKPPYAVASKRVVLVKTNSFLTTTTLIVEVALTKC